MRVKKRRDTLRHAYLQYLKDTKDKPEEFKVTYRQYIDICYAFNKKLSEELIENGSIYKLPFHLGELSIKRRKMKYNSLKVDFGELKKTGILTYHTNDHSREYYAFCHWNKSKCKVVNKSVYSFTLSRDNKRAIATRMKDGVSHQMFEIIQSKKK